MLKLPRSWRADRRRRKPGAAGSRCSGAGQPCRRPGPALDGWAGPWLDPGGGQRDGLAGFVRLSDELAVVRGELCRVDDKCGVLAAVATGASAFSLTQLGHGPIASRAVLGVAGVAFAAAVLALLAVLRPRLGTEGWCRFVPMSASEIQHLADYGRDSTGSLKTGTFAAAADLAALSRLAYRKFRWLRRATDLATAGVVFLGTGIILAAVS